MLGSLLEVAQQSQEEPATGPIELRRGLPLGCLYQGGYQAGLTHGLDKAHAETCASLASVLRALADKVEKTPLMASLATDLASVDFMENRLPPHPSQLAEQGPEPSPGCRVRARAPGICRIYPMLDPEAQLESGERLVKVVSCLHNSLEDHMMGKSGHGHQHGSCEDGTCNHAHHGHDDASDDDKEEEEGEKPGNKAPHAEEEDNEDSEDEDDVSEAPELVFPESFAKAIAMILACHDDTGVAVKGLPLPEEEAMACIEGLWAEGFISVIPTPAGGKEKRAKGQAGAKEPAKKKQKH